MFRIVSPALLLCVPPRAIPAQENEGRRRSRIPGIVLTDGLKRQRDPPPSYPPRQ